RAGVEKLLQLPDHAEDADLLVLEDVIEIRDRDEPLRCDLLVVRLDSLRDPRLAERLSRTWANANQLGEALVRRRRGVHVLLHHGREHVVDLLVQRVGERGIADQIAREASRYGLA